MALPSVLLHDHLDGGLRPATVLELADEHGYEGLPETDVGALAKWFDQSESGSLETYLDAFDHTIAVIQTRRSLQAAFCDWATKAELWEDVFASTFRDAGADVDEDWAR